MSIPIIEELLAMTDFVLIGSRAADFRGIRLRQNIFKSDFDLVTTPKKFECFRDWFETYGNLKESSKHPGKFTWQYHQAKTRYEIDATDNPSNQTLLDFIPPVSHYSLGLDAVLKRSIIVSVAPLDVLYLIKRSHANYPIHFDKTISDLIKLSRHRFNHDTKSWEHLFYTQRREEAKLRYGHTQHRINLNKPNMVFFKPAEGLRKYDHDWIHENTCKYDRPLFEKCKRDLTLAKIERDLFEKLTFDDKLNMIQEEAVVIGIERFYLNGIVSDPIQVYRRGLAKFLRDLCKGWFQDFALDNIQHLTHPKWDYLSKFEQARKTVE